MKILGYVAWHPTSQRLHVYPDPPPVTGGRQLAAVVAVADLDVEAAVERAARARHAIWCCTQGNYADWDGLAETSRETWRNHVRPIVLAALGVES